MKFKSENYCIWNKLKNHINYEIYDYRKFNNYTQTIVYKLSTVLASFNNKTIYEF